MSGFPDVSTVPSQRFLFEVPNAIPDTWLCWPKGHSVITRSALRNAERQSIGGKKFATDFFPVNCNSFVPNIFIAYIS